MEYDDCFDDIDTSLLQFDAGLTEDEVNEVLETLNDDVNPGNDAPVLSQKLEAEDLPAAKVCS